MISPDFTNSDRAHLVRFVQHRVRSRETAEDIAQEALLRAHKFEHRGESTFTTWLYKIALNLVYEQHRKPSRREVAADMERAEDRRTERSVEHFSMREQVRLAMEDIDPSFRNALHWRYWDGLSMEEIAEKSGSTVGAVKCRLFRAKAALRKRLMN